MPELKIILDPEGTWEDLKPGGDKAQKLRWNQHTSMTFARLAKGMQSGAPSVAIRLDMEGGGVIVAETSMALFLSAAKCFIARDEFEREEAAKGKPS
jgi:hypothetical protein